MCVAWMKNRYIYNPFPGNFPKKCSTIKELFVVLLVNRLMLTKVLDRWSYITEGIHDNSHLPKKCFTIKELFVML